MALLKTTDTNDDAATRTAVAGLLFDCISAVEDGIAGGVRETPAATTVGSPALERHLAQHPLFGPTTLALGPLHTGSGEVRGACALPLIRGFGLGLELGLDVRSGAWKIARFTRDASQGVGVGEASGRLAVGDRIMAVQGVPISSLEREGTVEGVAELLGVLRESSACFVFLTVHPAISEQPPPPPAAAVPLAAAADPTSAQPAASAAAAASAPQHAAAVAGVAEAMEEEADALDEPPGGEGQGETATGAAAKSPATPQLLRGVSPVARAKAKPRPDAKVAMDEGCGSKERPSRKRQLKLPYTPSAK